ncbi:MAG: virulence factor SrfB, partial [Alphaproteobacteria bacterium]
MLKSLPTYRPLTSLIPRSGIQFLDSGFDIDRAARVSRAYWEEATGTAADAPVNLHCLERDAQTRDYVTKDAAHKAIEPSYVINADRALEVFLGQWVPVPFLRIRERAPDGHPVFARGPSNWARVRVVALDEKAAGEKAQGEKDRDGNTHRVTLAFDTELAEQGGGADGGHYLAPTPEDARSGQVFALAEDDRDNSWFIADDWVDEWLYELFIDYRRRQRGGRPVAEGDLQWACEHYARYLTFLQVLADLKLFPRIQLVDTDTRPRKYRPIGVDLVLDVGNSRTCGILIEADPDDKIDLNNSYVLELRDLSRPHLAYNRPFESRLEFAKPAFGRDHLSRRSGRPNAFNWPLVARVGPEAAWLASQAKGTEGATGMSSPKRYLWDVRARNQDWRFNGRAAPGTAGFDQDDQAFEPPVTTGIFVQHLTEDGVPLDDPKLPAAARIPALRSRYSRSSLMIFVLSEIILHALVMANSAEQRGKRPYEDVPRQLERVIMTMPTAMPKAERDILRHRAEAAVRLLWKSMGWKGDDPNQPQPPKVLLDWDEASCTQLVYLYSEIAHKFQGDIRGFFSTIGRPRMVSLGNGGGGQPVERPSLRVASIDVGGGTTDLIITTYRLEGDRTIVPLQ